jgi:prepilin-type N-terminal cleavage/methylation domain-containing protein
MKINNNKNYTNNSKYNYYNSSNYNNYNNNAFSLIELSIVLIIMGLLVAGVTGGASLIKSAQLRSVITEYQTYKVAYNTYYGMYSKVPGDSEGNGEIGSSQLAWEDLKGDGLIDKDPDREYVPSKFKSAFWSLEYNEVDFTNTPLRGANLIYVSTSSKGGIFNAKDTANLLDKMDDGKPNSGLMRAFKNADTQVESLENGTLYGLVAKLDF